MLFCRIYGWPRICQQLESTEMIAYVLLQRDRLKTFFPQFVHNYLLRLYNENVLHVLLFSDASIYPLMTSSVMIKQ